MQGQSKIDPFTHSNRWIPGDVDIESTQKAEKDDGITAVWHAVTDVRDLKSRIRDFKTTYT